MSEWLLTHVLKETMQDGYKPFIVLISLPVSASCRCTDLSTVATAMLLLRQQLVTRLLNPNDH